MARVDDEVKRFTTNGNQVTVDGFVDAAITER